LLLPFVFLAFIFAGCDGVEPETYFVSGQVLDNKGVGIEGVMLNFSGGFGTAETDENGKWSKPGLEGTVTITPVKEGWTFEPENLEVSAEAVDVDFVGEIVVSAIKYTLKIKVEGEGKVDPPEGVYDYEEGDEVQLEATPEEDWAFSHWVGDVEEQDAAATTVIMDEDKTIKAVFEKEFEDHPIEFNDENLEKAIREAIGKMEGELFLSDVIDLEELNARGREIESLEGIQHLQNIKMLYLQHDRHDSVDRKDWTYNKIEDLAPLKKLISLEALNFRYNKVSDISPLENLTSLEWLMFWHNEVVDISPLENLISLEILHFSGNQVADISALENLTSLEVLSFWSNEVPDISSLQNLINLKVLSFYSNQVSDISALEDLTGLERLSFYSNQVPDISSLQNLTSLKSLDFSSNEVSDVSSLANLTELERLSFSRNEVSDISSLQNLINLQWLSFRENKVSDIAALVNNPGFGNGDEIDMRWNYLDLTPDSKNMQDINSLMGRGVSVEYEPQYPRFTLEIMLNEDEAGEVHRDPCQEKYLEGTVVVLTAVSNEGWVFSHWGGDAEGSDAVIEIEMDGDKTIEAFFDKKIGFADENLEEVVREKIGKPTGDIYESDVIGVEELDANAREIKSLEGIQHLQNLEDLKFGYNQVSDISPLESLINLEWLFFVENAVSDISSLQSLTSLKGLLFGNNSVSDISPLENLNKLEWLSCSNNLVSDISPLQNLINLEVLYFRENRVSDISALVNNPGFGNGDEIDMRWNYLDLTPGSQNMQDINNLIGRGVGVHYDPQHDPPGKQTSHSTAGGVTFYLRLAPAATFPTGTSDDGEATVGHNFWVAETQVTYELWYEVREWAEDNGYTFIREGREGSDGDTGKEPSSRKNEPVTRINWYDSIVWCNALSEYMGYTPIYTVNGQVVRDVTNIDHQDVVAEEEDGFRLLTSNEWELAARYQGSNSSHGALEYPVGSGQYWTPGNYASGATDDYNNEEATRAAAWYEENSGGKTRDVGQKPGAGNGLGAFDMSGNVWEWCFTQMGNGAYRVIRGGSWHDDASELQISKVSSNLHFSSNNFMGLRLARTHF